MECQYSAILAYLNARCLGEFHVLHGNFVNYIGILTC